VAIIPRPPIVSRVSSSPSIQSSPTTDKSSILGSGNFEIITGGLFKQKSSNSDDEDYEYYERPSRTRHRNKKWPTTASKIHPNDILSNFRDFAEINYRADLSEIKPITIKSSSSHLSNLTDRSDIMLVDD
jgi:hypothetical protein